jgi:hypothetical protein
VFRLITFFASALCLAVFVWFGLTVDLGEHTLFGHIKAISDTPEAEKLVKGARSKVTDLVGIEAAKHAQRERARLGKTGDQKGDGDGDGNGAEPATAPPTAPAGPPQEELQAQDRQGLRKMIEDKKPAARAPAREAPAPAKGRVPPPTSRRPPSTP